MSLYHPHHRSLPNAGSNPKSLSVYSWVVITSGLCEAISNHDRKGDCFVAHYTPRNDISSRIFRINPKGLLGTFPVCRPRNQRYDSGTNPCRPLGFGLLVMSLL